MALPTTLLLVAFNVTVLIALFVYANNEMRASKNAAGSSSSRIMALNGIELAGALIVANSTNNAYVSYQNIITNLPNDTNARLETKIANVVPIPGAADPSFQRQVTNPTALHSGFASPGQGVDLNYATSADTNSGYILPRTNPVGSNWRNLHTNMFQMKWVNVYKGNSSDPTNLVGRFAFWVDDESTKLNINYSGARSLYVGYDLGTRYVADKLVGPRADKVTNEPLGGNFMGEMWPQWMELGGVAGLSRTNIIQILERRGDFLDRNTALFKPYYSVLETRLGTLPPAPGGLGVTNVIQQSQLGFTATVFSREPEITYATGRPRFDLFNFTMNWANNPTRMTEAETGLLNSFNLNYPEFSTKYSLPQFIAAVRAYRTRLGNGIAAATNFPYSPSGEETPNFNARSMPLLNEVELKLESRINGNTNISTISANVELIFLFKAFGSTASVNSIMDELHMTGGAFSAGLTNYSIELKFDPKLEFGDNTITNSYTNMVLYPDPARWFSNSSDSNSLKANDINLSGMFAIFTNRFQNSFTNCSTIFWKAPSSVTTIISYGNSSSNRVSYQQVTSTYSLNTTTQSNQITSSNNVYLFHWNSFPRPDQGVRGDPRLGLHQVEFKSEPGQINGFTNHLQSSTGNLNTNSWQPGNFATQAFSPDITPPETFFVVDKGPFYGQQHGDSYLHGPWFPSSGHLGEIPITTSKNGTNLAWSTPRFWGDGRTNMGDGRTSTPDWFMLDCVHTAMFPPNTNRLFTTYNTNSFVSHGRLNINSLKSYFQTPRGSADRSDTIFDSALIGLYLKDFRDSSIGLSGWKTITKSETSRTNLLNYINKEALRRGSLDDPFLTGFDFTAHLAGNTNPTLTSVKDWEFYTPGKTTTTDSRIESLVRSLQQRVTSRGFQFSVFSLGQSVQVVPSGSTYTTNVIGESFFQAVWERAPKHNLDGTISNASSGGAPPLRLLYLRELR